MTGEKKKEIWRVVKFVLFSASAGIIETVAMILCEEVLKIPGHWVCYTIALVLSVLWNFTFNRKFTFKDAGNVPKAMLLAFLFYVPFYPFQTWYVHTIKSLLVDAIGVDGAGIIAEGTVMIINFALEFMWQKFVVFRKKAAK